MSERRESPRRRQERRGGIDIVDRTMPHNIEAERCVLGAVLMHNDAYLTAQRMLARDDFYRESHRRIYSAIERLLERPHGTVDIVSLKEELARTQDLDEAGGPAYISSLIDGVPRSTNVSAYATIVKEKSQLRGLIWSANKMLTDAYDQEDSAEDILRRADQEIIDLQHGQSTGRMRALAQTTGELLDEMEWFAQHRDELTGVDTGFESINRLTMGWQPGDMVIIAARPSIGKTAFVLNTAVAAVKSRRRDGEARHAAIFSLEMRRRQLERRLLAAETGLALTTLQTGWVPDEQWGVIANALGEMNEWGLHIDDTARRTVSDVRSECRRLRAEHGLDLVVIDYVQLLQGSSTRRNATRNEELTEISRSIKLMADELACCVIVLSQLRRTHEKSRPQLSDLRESGALEQDADAVAFLHRQNHRESGLTEFIMEKQRNGSTGTCNLTFSRDTQQFTDGGEETQEQATAKVKEEDEHAKVKAILKAQRRKKKND